MKQRSTQKPRKPKKHTEYGRKKTTVKRTKRTDALIWLRQEYVGNVHANPVTYNRAFADVLRQMADAITNVRDAWVDPEVVVWMHVDGEITAEVTLSPKG
jgi:hypothetical protein